MRSLQLLRLLRCGPLCASLLVAGTASAESPAFGPQDIPTLFFISKSDDKNRVDYGIRLGPDCAPTDDKAIFPYWREFEHAPPVRTHRLGVFEHLAYGIAEQRVLVRSSTGSELVLRLRRIHRDFRITIKKEAGGGCGALVRASIGGVESAELLSAFVQLRRPMSVAHVDIHGRDPHTGQALEERVKE